MVAKRAKTCTMKNAMNYKGYAARIEFDAQDRIFFGRLVGIQDIVTFHGATVDELEAAFEEAVDHYLNTCAELGDDPNKSYSGKLTLRIPPKVHAAIATAAETSGKSLNKWAAEVLDQAAHTQ
jgi:predicted HicB family RNase H-like nuclease